MANLFSCCVNIGGVNFSVYDLETKGGIDIVDLTSSNYVLSWDCTSVTNWERLNINNFSFGGTYDADNSPIRYEANFGGQGNSDLARNVSVYLLKAEYNSTSGIYELTFYVSKSRPESWSSRLRVTPRIFIPN